VTYTDMILYGIIIGVVAVGVISFIIVAIKKDK